MGTMVYKWKPQTVIAVAAQLVGEELELIRIKHNDRLTQEDVVTEAKKKQSPLHPAFEWDDAVAGHNFRLDQASYLIRSITMTIEGDETKPPVRAFVNVERDSDRSYTSTVHAMSDKELRAQVLARALGELEAWRVRYNELTELARLFTEIDKAAKRLKAA